MKIRFGRVAQLSAIWFACVLASCGGGGGTPTPPPDPPDPPPVADGPMVKVWLTTSDRASLLAPKPDVQFATGSSGTNRLLIDERFEFQTIEGFGAAFTDSSAYLLNQVATTSARDSAMNNLFTRTGSGIGLSFMRTPMGASDLARTHYSYDDMPAGQTDAPLANFSIAHDEADIIPIIKQAKQLNPDMKLMASPWSPPGWMKSSDALIGGSLLPSMYTPYANYFVKYLQAYAADGVTVDYISLQNEPGLTPSDYPGLNMDAATQTVVLRDYVLPALQSNSLSTKVLAFDFNWDNTDFPSAVLNEATIANSNQVAGIAWHWYGGTPGAMTTLHNLNAGKGQYVTEASGGTWVTDEVRSDFESIIQSMRNWSSSFVKWGLALDQNRGPHAGGCGTCTPLVTVNSTTGAVTYPIDFYTLGQFSKFVLPGAKRVYSSNAQGIVSAAFVNPDASKALVAFNDTSASNTFQVQWGTMSFSYSLPRYSGATFTWNGTQGIPMAPNATQVIQASSYRDVHGLQTETCTDTNGGFDLGFADEGDYAIYSPLSFGTGVTGISARVASAGSGGTIEFHLDSIDGPLVATVNVPVTGGWQTWTTVSTTATGASGMHGVWAVFKGGAGIGNLNWFQFR